MAKVAILFIVAFVPSLQADQLTDSHSEYLQTGTWDKDRMVDRYIVYLIEKVKSLTTIQEDLKRNQEDLKSNEATKNAEIDNLKSIQANQSAEIARYI